MTAPVPPLPVPPADLDAGALVDALSVAVGLPVAPAHRPGVVANMALAARMASLVMGLSLAPSDEPAPVFTP